jgi:hypothetical protein
MAASRIAKAVQVLPPAQIQQLGEQIQYFLACQKAAFILRFFNLYQRFNDVLLLESIYEARAAGELPFFELPYFTHRLEGKLTAHRIAVDEPVELSDLAAESAALLKTVRIILYHELSCMTELQQTESEALLPRTLWEGLSVRPISPELGQFLVHYPADLLHRKHHALF